MSLLKNFEVQFSKIGRKQAKVKLSRLLKRFSTSHLHGTLRSETEGDGELPLPFETLLRNLIRLREKVLLSKDIYIKVLQIDKRYFTHVVR